MRTYRMIFALALAALVLAASSVIVGRSNDKWADRMMLAAYTLLAFAVCLAWRG